MATRRRRAPTTKTESVSVGVPDGAWDDFSAEAPELAVPDGAWDDFSIEAPELTHEEMLEVAAEREAEPVVEKEKEEEVVEVFLAASLADTFEAVQKAEEEKGADNFFDPGFYKQEIRYPAPTTDFVPTAPTPPQKRRPRHILRENTRRRKG